MSQRAGSSGVGSDDNRNDIKLKELLKEEIKGETWW